MTEIIPNGTGAEVREDINDEFTKLETTNVTPTVHKAYGSNNIVPILTSNTSSSIGTAFSEGTTRGGGDYSAWKAFDGVLPRFTTYRASVNGVTAYVGYLFNIPQVVKGLSAWVSSDGYGFTAVVKFQGSTDTTNGTDGTWIDLYTSGTLDTTKTAQATADLSNNILAYKAVRLISVSYAGYFLPMDNFEIFTDVVASTYPTNPVDGQTVFDINAKVQKVYYNGTWY